MHFAFVCFGSCCIQCSTISIHHLVGWILILCSHAGFFASSYSSSSCFPFSSVSFFHSFTLFSNESFAESFYPRCVRVRVYNYRWVWLLNKRMYAVQLGLIVVVVKIATLWNTIRNGVFISTTTDANYFCISNTSDKFVCCVRLTCFQPKKGMEWSERNYRSYKKPDQCKWLGALRFTTTCVYCIIQPVLHIQHARIKFTSNFHLV